MKKLGFGAMRLPEINGGVDYELTCQMFDGFLDNGFTYFDTAYGYLGGQSEIAIRECLTKRHPRESYLLADKMPVWLLKTEDDLQRLFSEQLEKTGVSYFDYYLLHALNKNYIELLDNLHVWDFLYSLKERGLAKKIGFSFHDTPQVLDKLLESHPGLDFVQLQINYHDWEDTDTQSKACYETAVRYGLDVVVMEPVRGGALAELPKAAKEAFYAAAPNRSQASWALRYVAQLEKVLIVLSGMSTPEQVADNTQTFLSLAPFSDAENKTIEAVQQILRETPSIPCTFCKYCIEKCPQEIPIPQIINACNMETQFNHAYGLTRYRFVTGNKPKASACINCGICASRCPQHIAIPDILKQAAEKFE